MAKCTSADMHLRTNLTAIEARIVDNETNPWYRDLDLSTWRDLVALLESVLEKQ